MICPPCARAADERRPEHHDQCVGDGCTCQHHPVGDRQEPRP